MFLTASNDQANNLLSNLYQVQVFVLLYSLYVLSERALLFEVNNSKLFLFVGGCLEC
jgi:hypothetical protein